MKGNERINAGAVIQAYLNAGITELPTSMQINNYVSNKKRTLEISGDFNFVDMENMVREIKETESEVVEFKYRIDEENPSKTDWEIIITCKQMLDDQRNQKHGNIDSTFKLIFGGFPVMVWGYSDINRHIHPTGVAIISSETIETYKWLFEFLKSNRFCNGEWIPAEFVADNAQCITTALREVFPEVHRRNCIAHIIRHIFDVKFGEYGIDKQTDGERIKNEILELANHAFENHFDIAGAALIAKWKASDHEGIVQFADYFDREYIQKNKFWYAANGQGIRQNNGMEGSNKWIKRDFINRRLPLMEAIAALKKWLYVCAHKNYGNPAISVKTNEWIAAHDLKSVTKVIFSGGTWYVRRSKSEWDETDYRDYLEYYTDLDNVLDAGDVELFQKNIVVVTRSTLYENEFTCNCPIGALRTRCKHVLLIQVFCNHREWPNMPALRQTINGTARTRPGRPRKHTQALSRI
uniref:SWIM-type domain-containing protein n=1 Tax=Panagrolaimus superbus TaxID=310955 RepID=A0A914Z431_9BILA